MKHLKAVETYQLIHEIKEQMLGTTVVIKLNQGTIRHRGACPTRIHEGLIIDGGALFGYFLGKQKVTKRNSW